MLDIKIYTVPLKKKKKHLIYLRVFLKHVSFYSTHNKKTNILQYLTELRLNFCNEKIINLYTTVEIILSVHYTFNRKYFRSRTFDSTQNPLNENKRRFIILNCFFFYHIHMCVIFHARNRVIISKTLIYGNSVVKY